MTGQGALEEAARLGGLAVAAPDEHRCRHLVERERLGERLEARKNRVRAARFRTPCYGDGTDAVGTESPGNWFNSALLLRTLVAIVASAGLACAAAPASERTHTIPIGVTVAGLHVGRAERRARARRDRRRVHPARHDRPTTAAQTIVEPAQIGAGTDVDAAVGSALAATPSSEIALPVTYSRVRATRIVASLADRIDRPARSARGGRRDLRRSGVRARETGRRRRRDGDRDRTGPPPRRRNAPALAIDHAQRSRQTDDRALRAGDRRHPEHEHASALRRPQARAHLPGRDRPGDLPDARRRLADREQAARPVVVSADLRRVGEGAEAGAARPVEPARDALDGPDRARRRHPRHRRSTRRSATAPRTAASGCTSPTPSGSSSTCASARPSSFSRQGDAEPRQHDHEADERQQAAEIHLGCPDSRTVAANARPSRISTAPTRPMPITSAGSQMTRRSQLEAAARRFITMGSCPNRFRLPIRTTAPATTTSSSSSATASRSAAPTSRSASSQRRSSSAWSRANELDEDEIARPRRARRARRDRGARSRASAATSSATGSACRSSTASRSSTGCAS